MKIAIYGDSFSCINTKWDYGRGPNEHLGESWVEILEKNNTIYNFSASGTAFMYSYEIFLREHKNYDLNIFAVTSPHRTYIKALDGIKMFGYTWADSEYARIKKLPSYDRKDIHLEILKSVRSYLEHWADWDMIIHTQHVLVNNLWNLSPSTVVIPCFDNSIEQTQKNVFECSMHELSLVDKIQHSKFNFNKLNCKRKCHFSKENNVVLVDKILDAIESKKKYIELDRDEMITPVGHDFNFYVEEWP